MSPRPAIDYDGVSFSTIPPSKSMSYVVTTVNIVNPTSNIRAVVNGKNHVSIIPINGTVEEWMSLGKDSEWTESLANIVIEF